MPITISTRAFARRRYHFAIQLSRGWKARERRTGGLHALHRRIPELRYEDRSPHSRGRPQERRLSLCIAHQYVSLLGFNWLGLWSVYAAPIIFTLAASATHV